MKGPIALRNNYQDKLARIRSLDDEIILLVKDDDYDNEFDIAMQENDRSYGILIRIDDRINKSPTSIPSAISSVSTPTTDQVNLPKLQLRKFDGSPLHWQSFWDQYAAAIHSKAGMQM